MRGTAEAPISFRPKDSAITVLRKVIDPSALMIKSIEAKLLHGGTRPFLAPHSSYARDVLAPFSNPTDVAALCTTRLMGIGLSQHRVSVNSLVFLPDQHRVWSASQAGAVSVWTAGSLATERAVPAHNAGIKVMRFNRSGTYMISGDVEGSLKYWDSSLTPCEDFRAHREPINGIDFAPSDQKYVTCSDDGFVRVWSFYADKPTVDCELRGHGSNVTSVSWHPSKSLIASSSKDNSIRLWDANSASEVANLSHHTGWALRTLWNPHNGWWLASTSRDQTIRLIDIRTMKPFSVISTEHRGVTSLAWHPHSEPLLATGAFDGCLQFWSCSDHPEYPVAEIPHAHDNAIWDLAWHPMGHQLVSCSSDTTVKGWAQVRPGDTALQYAYQGNPSKQYPNSRTITTPAINDDGTSSGTVSRTINNENIVAVVPKGSVGGMPASAVLAAAAAASSSSMDGWGAMGLGGAGAYAATTAAAAAASRAALLQQAAAAAAASGYSAANAGESFEAVEAEAKRTFATGERAQQVKAGAFAAKAAAAGFTLQQGGRAPNLNVSAAPAASSAAMPPQMSMPQGSPPAANYGMQPSAPGQQQPQQQMMMMQQQQQQPQQQMMMGGPPPFGGGGGGFGGPRNFPPNRPPPPGYLCKVCNIPGHFIDDCPQREVRRGMNVNAQAAPGAVGDGSGAPPQQQQAQMQMQMQPQSAGAGGFQQGAPPSSYPQQTGPKELPPSLPKPGGPFHLYPNPDAAAMVAQTAPPPPPYACVHCKGVGEHYMEMCPWLLPPGTRGFKEPPAEYVCHGCGRGGHWKPGCPRLARLASLGVTQGPPPREVRQAIEATAAAAGLPPPALPPHVAPPLQQQQQQQFAGQRRPYSAISGGPGPAGPGGMPPPGGRFPGAPPPPQQQQQAPPPGQLYYDPATNSYFTVGGPPAPSPSPTSGGGPPAPPPQGMGMGGMPMGMPPQGPDAHYQQPYPPPAKRGRYDGPPPPPHMMMPQQQHGGQQQQQYPPPPPPPHMMMMPPQHHQQQPPQQYYDPATGQVITVGGPGPGAGGGVDAESALYGGDDHGGAGAAGNGGGPGYTY